MSRATKANLLVIGKDGLRRGQDGEKPVRNSVMIRKQDTRSGSRAVKWREMTNVVLAGQERQEHLGECPSADALGEALFIRLLT